MQPDTAELECTPSKHQNIDGQQSTIKILMVNSQPLWAHAIMQPHPFMVASDKRSGSLLLQTGWQRHSEEIKYFKNATVPC
jgi:hypothetical protein